MNNTKIIAREIELEAIDFSFFFDDDGMRSAGGENCAVYIPETRNTIGLNADEYNDIVKQANDIIEAFEDIGTYYKNHKEAMEDCNIKYTSKKCSLLKKWAGKANTANSDDIAEFLTITTGKKYNSRSFSGYCQGDWCEVVYCEETHSDEGIEMIGNMYLGCGTEFDIDGCRGYFVLDVIRWKENDELKQYLADLYGCNVNEIEVQICTGSHAVTVAEYATI